MAVERCCEVAAGIGFVDGMGMEALSWSRNATSSGETAVSGWADPKAEAEPDASPCSAAGQGSDRCYQVLADAGDGSPKTRDHGWSSTKQAEADPTTAATGGLTRTGSSASARILGGDSEAGSSRKLMRKRGFMAGLHIDAERRSHHFRVWKKLVAQDFSPSLHPLLPGSLSVSDLTHDRAASLFFARPQPGSYLTAHLIVLAAELDVPRRLNCCWLRRAPP